MFDLQKLTQEQDIFSDVFERAALQLKDVTESDMDRLIEDMSYVEESELENISMLMLVDEKMSVADAIKAKKTKRKRDKTAAGKIAKRKLKIKMSRSSYRPNKVRSRKSKKGARIRRNIPGVSK